MNRRHYHDIRAKALLPTTERQWRALFYLERLGKGKRATPTAVIDHTDGPCMKRDMTTVHWKIGDRTLMALTKMGFTDKVGTRRHYTYGITDYGLEVLAFLRKHGKIKEACDLCECLESAEK